MNLFPSSVKKRLKELRSVNDVIGLRTSMNALRSGFLNTPTMPVLRDTIIKRDDVRSLYYNTNPQLSNGAFCAVGIVDGTADFIGLPDCTFDDAQLTAEVNKWVTQHWQSSLWQIYRDALRDSDVWVRLRKPFPSPLLDNDEADICTLEVIDTDRVQDFYDPVTGELIRIEIDSWVFIEDEQWTPGIVMQTGARVYGREHLIKEIITKDSFYFYDSTLGEFLDNYQMDNKWGFVPLVKIYNDFDSALKGGRSDLEQAYPFIKALHDVVSQTRSAQTYHADPKVKFKLNDVDNFLRNNWPESFGSDGKFTGKVSWRDKDIFFMESDEDANFIEAQINIGESVSFAEFLIDCICIAGEVTEGILFRAKAEQPTQGGDEFFRFKKKINRKRDNFAEYVQQIVRMATKISTGVAKRPQISWSAIDIADLASEGQAMNQIVTGAEVANRAGVISKNTYGHKIRKFFPAMLDPASESAQVQKEQQAEQDQQVAMEKKLQDIKTAAKPAAPNNNLGVNGAGRNGRTRTDVLPALLHLTTGGQGD